MARLLNQNRAERVRNWVRVKDYLGHSLVINRSPLVQLFGLMHLTLQRARNCKSRPLRTWKRLRLVTHRETG